METVPLTKRSHARIVFGHWVDGLFNKVLSAKIDTKCRTELRKIGLDLDKNLLTAYSFDAFEQASKIVVEHAFPDMPLREGLKEIGRLQIVGYQETPVGRALIGLMRLVSREQFLQRLTRSMKSGNTFMETQLKARTPSSTEVWFNDVGRYPEMVLGVLQAFAAAVGHDDMRVTIARHGRDGECVYLFSW